MKNSSSRNKDILLYEQYVEDNCNSAIEKMKAREFLLKLAEAYQKYDASIIKDYLADDMFCINVGPKMPSKKAYLDYLTRTLHAMKMHNVHMEFEIVQGRMHIYALQIANQQTPSGDYGGFVVDFNNEGKVKMLKITSSAFF